MAYGMHLATVHQQLTYPGRTGKWYGKDLIYNILTGECIINAQAILKELQICSYFIRSGVLRFQIGIKLNIVRDIGIIPSTGYNIGEPDHQEPE